jgi:A/G-specific adenine glycosylase
MACHGKFPPGLAGRLLRWFAAARRPMPWRAAPTPYTCWLSEIMLQQTTYQTALPYYERFLAAFPTVDALAAAPEQAVLKAWEGLGYYARARNLHQAAQRFAAHGWPRTAREWADAPGIGPYTAAALASVLAGEKVPVVDGNVARVFARLWRLEDDFSKLPARERLAARLVPYIRKCAGVSLADEPACDNAAGIFNQAMMELGALVCLPSRPACATCPLARDCAARKAGDQTDYPRKAARKPLPVRRVTSAVILDADGRVLLAENRDGGLLKGLWELPSLAPAGDHTQTFSHFRLDVTVLAAARRDARFVHPADVPLTTATRKILEEAGCLVRPPKN